MTTTEHLQAMTTKPESEDFESQTSASDKVFYGIINGLDTHHFVPGQRLVESDLATHFGVGRNSVREALQRLAADGIIEIVRHKSAVVRSLSLRETLDVLDVAERMTGLLAKTAARAVADGSATEDLIQALRLLEAAVQTNSPEDFSRARRQFYRLLLDLGGSQELRRMFRAIHMPIVHAQHRLSSLQKIRLRDYQVIGQAVLRGDEIAADTTGMDHVRNVRNEILKLR
jgi:DNA-binding GntR family transcriptional regulator